MMLARSLLKTLRRTGGARPFLFYGGLLALFGAAFWSTAHQPLKRQNPFRPHNVVFNEQPRIANLKRLFPQLYRENPVLVAEHRG